MGVWLARLSMSNVLMKLLEQREARLQQIRLGKHELEQKEARLQQMSLASVNMLMKLLSK